MHLERNTNAFGHIFKLTMSSLWLIRDTCSRLLIVKRLGQLGSNIPCLCSNHNGSYLERQKESRLKLLVNVVTKLVTHVECALKLSSNECFLILPSPSEKPNMLSWERKNKATLFCLINVGGKFKWVGI